MERAFMHNNTTYFRNNMHLHRYQREFLKEFLQKDQNTSFLIFQINVLDEMIKKRANLQAFHEQSILNTQACVYMRARASVFPVRECKFNILSQRSAE